MVGNAVRDKDGISAAAVFAEMTAFLQVFPPSSRSPAPTPSLPPSCFALATPSRHLSFCTGTASVACQSWEW